MITLILGYFVMVLIFLLFRFFYHILPKKNSHNNLIQAFKNDFVNLDIYTKQLILPHPKIVKFIVLIMLGLIVVPMIPWQIEIFDIIEDTLSAIMFFLLIIIFAPRENLLCKGFPIEIFSFTYSVIFMFYSAGVLVFDIFYVNDFFKEDIWFYGYSVTIISYIICIATLSRFMERDLTKQEIILVGMIMLTTLEFLTYYGIGFFGRIEHYNAQSYESNIFGNITDVINQGIFIASQSQILERSSAEIWGYIILNGTDVLTITVVLGYLVQKFMEM